MDVSISDLTFMICLPYNSSFFACLHEWHYGALSQARGNALQSGIAFELLIAQAQLTASILFRLGIVLAAGSGAHAWGGSQIVLCGLARARVPRAFGLLRGWE